MSHPWIKEPNEPEQVITSNLAIPLWLVCIILHGNAYPSIQLKQFELILASMQAYACFVCKQFLPPFFIWEPIEIGLLKSSLLIRDLLVLGFNLQDWHKLQRHEIGTPNSITGFKIIRLELTFFLISENKLKVETTLLLAFPIKWW